MNTRIWKYDVDRVIQLPKGAKVLHVAMQGTRTVLWAEVNPAAPLVDRILSLVGTGHLMAADRGDYIGTVHELEPDALHEFVWHLYISPEETTDAI